MSEDLTMAYHLRGGVVFEKRPGGRVQISLSDASGRTCLALAEAEEWASVVAAMSHGGEALNHADALDLHIPPEELAAFREEKMLAASKAAEEARLAAERAQAAAGKAAEAAAVAERLKLPRKVKGGAEAPKAQ